MILLFQSTECICQLFAQKNIVDMEIQNYTFIVINNSKIQMTYIKYILLWSSFPLNLRSIQDE